MQIVYSNNHKPGKATAAAHAARAYLLWQNTRIPLADAVERVCGFAEEAHMATVMLLCQLKYMGEQK